MSTVSHHPPAQEEEEDEKEDGSLDVRRAACCKVSRRNEIVSNQNDEANPLPSKLQLLIPGVGPFFTRLPLEAGFKVQDHKRYISSRRFVSPSFNDVRLILNSAQIMAVTTYGTLQLATFDGDVTLYDDGQSLEPTSPVIPRLLGEYHVPCPSRRTAFSPVP